MQGARCCFDISCEITSPTLELKCDIVCESGLNWEEYIDANGENYIGLDNKVYEVKRNIKF